MKYKIFMLQGNGNYYKSVVVDYASSIEQAIDKVNELQAETGCSIYFEEEEEVYE